jgi:hypothetical protein
MVIMRGFPFGVPAVWDFLPASGLSATFQISDRITRPAADTLMKS